VQQLVAVYTAIAAENRAPLRGAVGGLNAASTDLRRFIQTGDSSAVLALESFRRTSDDLSELVGSLRPLSTVADTMAVSLRSGNSALAELVRSRELYDNLRRTSASIDSLLVDLKRNPGKYTKNMKFRVSLF
jgi:ABC-type transporter Mla subunit MlaD